MDRLLRLLAAAAAAAAIIVAPAGAVIGGSPDGDSHPYVGLSAFFDAQGNFLWRCSGTLVAPTVYVTAGHCTGPEAPGAPAPAFAAIWFGSGVVSSKTAPDAVGTPVPSPAWTGTLPDHDIGVVKLWQPVTDRGFATLAPPGYLDGLTTRRGRQDVSFTVVGYGIQDFGPLGFTAIPMRFAGQVQLENVTAVDLLTTAAPGTGTGGSATCLGDSGGPVFSGGYLVAATSFGSKYCNGRSGAFRLDTLEAQSFITGA
jgi:hypothetical protein